MPSKLGLHMIEYSPDLRRLVEAGAPLVKLAGNFEAVREILALRPETIVVGRVVEANDILDDVQRGLTPEASAQAFVARQSEQYESNPLIKIWEGPHEPAIGAANDPQAMQRMAWYAAFEAERLRLLADLGLRGVIGNFATGTPDLPLWAAFIPALDAAETHHGYLGLHEYSSPWMWWLMGRYQPQTCQADMDIPGEGDTGWATLRYRKVYREHLAPNGVDDVPLLITECGLDRIGSVCIDHTDGPWRAHAAFWANHDGAHDPIDYWRGAERDVERYYAEQLMWYDGELQKDTYVVGAALFTLGAPEDAAQSEISGTRVVDHLADYLRRGGVQTSLIERRAHLIAPAMASAADERVSFALPSFAPAEPLKPAKIQVPRGPERAREAAAPNLLLNAGFEEGEAYFFDETRERAIPDGWQADFAAPGAAREPGQALPYGLAVTALINSHAVAPADRARIFAGGVYCWKVCGGRNPIRVRLWQAVASLEPEARYQFSVNVLPDVIVRAKPRPAYATDPLASEIRLLVDVDTQDYDSGWKTGHDMPFGKYSRLTLDFTAPAERALLAVEVRCRYPMPFGAWYVDELSLSPM
jgi:hypothetical protein